ncbi:MAG TPA: alpha/beta fold hydrolase, partial [Ktedonobacteraceae bacterium]|nr:alpha/beta fold hydrolase [Ktedonobacteraceae bacterium]
GESDKSVMDYSVSSLADFLAHFLDALGPDWQHVSLVGHSLGGAIALAFAQKYPERVEKLVLVDSAGLGPEIDAAVLDLMRSEPTPESIQGELTRFFAQPGMAQQSLVNQVYQQRTAPGAHAALRSTLEAAFGGNQQSMDLRPALASFSNPALIVWGDVDSVIPVTHTEEVKRGEHGQQSRVEVFASCGHCPHIERSDAFNDMVTSFLASA